MLLPGFPQTISGEQAGKTEGWPIFLTRMARVPRFPQNAPERRFLDDSGRSDSGRGGGGIGGRDRMENTPAQHSGRISGVDGNNHRGQKSLCQGNKQKIGNYYKFAETPLRLRSGQAPSIRTGLNPGSMGVLRVAGRVTLRRSAARNGNGRCATPIRPPLLKKGRDSAADARGLSQGNPRGRGICGCKPDTWVRCQTICEVRACRQCRGAAACWIDRRNALFPRCHGQTPFHR